MRRNYADRFTVVLDANVLYPFRVRDILLLFYEAGFYRARWSETILDEFSRNLIANRPELEKSINEQLEVIRSFFPEAMVEGYEPLIDNLKLPDEDDRHVLAAAIRCKAQHIVTENLKDFPVEALEPYELTAISADEFLSNTFELYPFDALSVLKKMRENYKKPEVTASELIMDLRKHRLQRLANHANDAKEFL